MAHIATLWPIWLVLTIAGMSAYTLAFVKRPRYHLNLPVAGKPSWYTPRNRRVIMVAGGIAFIVAGSLLSVAYQAHLTVYVIDQIPQ